MGADAIFACLGPALEIFSRYSRVEKASGEAVTLKEYLEHVWAAVAKEAFATNRTLREIVLEKKLMDAVTLDRALDPLSMMKP